MDARQERGMVIAATKKIQQRDGAWIVPSQTTNTRYTVIHRKERQTCTCPDHELGHVCKHIHAVSLVIQRELFDDGEGNVTETKSVTVTETKTTYRQNWRAYNAAQTNEKAKFQTLLRDLCQGIEEPAPQGRGRPRIPMADAIFSAAFKVYSTVSGRRFISDLTDAHAKGFISRLPHYNSIFNVFESEAVTPILKRLVEETAKPLKAIETNFAADSSGFSGSRHDKWFNHKWGKEQIKRAWVKAHIMTGVKTNVITAVEIHEKMASDSIQLPAMLRTTAETFKVEEVSADMVYSSVRNLETIDAMGAKPFIPFKSNASGKGNGLWARMYHFFKFNQDEFMSRYHQRSNVESTFSMMKAKFGDGVRSKTDVAMKNEVLCKMVCHNICCLIQAMYELGIEPTFWQD
jgi:transposase